MNSSDIRKFRTTVWKYYKEKGRHDLPWRKTKTPYRILISEVMLQQTQVPRVIAKYKEFLRAFPTVSRLARAPLKEVLRVWSGLGYNRRAKYLHDAAVRIVSEQGGKVPRDFAALRALPGIGPYTASAVRVFAFNEPDILIETNIRTALIEHFFVGKELVSDAAMVPIANSIANFVAKGQDPRKWHWALMDYGAHLKRSGVRNNHRSAHYAKQSKFEGSLRQVRGAILKALSVNGAHSQAQIYSLIRANRRIVASALTGLERDGLIVKVRPRRIGLGPKKYSPAR